MRATVTIAALLFAFSVQAGTLKVFGSASAEGQLTPANGASPLLRGNIEAIDYRTYTGDATAFADTAPESRRWKMHLKLRASEGLTIGEAYAQLNVRPWLDVTAGRVIEKWGTGYAWNPTGFVSPPKNPADPNDRRSAYQGLDMIRADAFVRETSISLYALRGGALAARVYRLVGGTDLSLHLRRDDRGMQQGISAARVFGDALELHGEVARRHALAGGQYTFRNQTNVVIELYHGGDGMSEAEWRAFCERVDAARDAASLIAANRDYQPLRMGRNYAFVRVSRPAWIETELIAIANLRDGSLLARLTLTRKLAANVSAYLIDTEFAGPRESEMAYMQVRRVTAAGVRVYF